MTRFVAILLALVAASDCMASREVDYAVSLRVLNERLQQCMPYCGPEAVLAGMTEVSGFLVDSSGNDVVLLGKREPSKEAIRTEDFVLALRAAIARRKGVESYFPGVSIELRNDVAKKLESLASSTAAAAIWRAVCGADQDVLVYGLPSQNSFVKTMVEADYKLKRFANGQLTAPFKSHSTRVEERILRTGKLGPGSMDRFELVPSTNKSWQVDRGSRTYIIENLNVVLFTEKQAKDMNIPGRPYVGTGAKNPEAEDFAADFTNQYEQIAQSHDEYKTLSNLFDLVAVTEFIAKTSALNAAGLRLSYMIDDFRVDGIVVDKTLPGISEINKVAGPPSFVSKTCGGVNAYMPAEDFRTSERRFSEFKALVLGILNDAMAVRVPMFRLSGSGF